MILHRALGWSAVLVIVLACAPSPVWAEATAAEAATTVSDENASNNGETPCGNGADTEASTESAETTEDEAGAATDASSENGDSEESAEKAEKEEEKPAKPETIAVKTEPLKIELAVDGAFGASTIHPIVVKAKSWSNYRIREVARHGQKVEKGDPLFVFDTEEIDRALVDRQRDVRLSEIALLEAQCSLKELEQALPIRVEQSEADKRQADEDFARYFKIYQDLNREIAKRNLESAEFSLEYAQKELDQLEKMYHADELTEETEEIVLTRQRRAVESAEFALRRARLYYEETMELDLPRMEQARKWSARLRDFAYQTSRETQPLRLEQARLQLERQTVQLERDKQKLDELRADRELMTIVSPAAGVVYYGPYKNGGFSGGSVESKLEPEKVLTSSDAVLVCVVEPRPLVVDASFPEKELHRLAADLKAEITPTAFPDLKLAGSIQKIDFIPGPDGSFRLMLAVETCDAAERVMPGLKCQAKIIVYQNDEAILVPNKAIKKVERDGKEESFVHLFNDCGESVEHPVTLGRENDGKVEILEGLKPGQEILAACPDEE